MQLRYAKFNDSKRVVAMSSSRWLVFLAMCCVAISGCASMTDKGKGKKNEDSKWSLFKKKEYQIPQSMNVTWVHDIISVPGKPPTRGFGGRIYFYNEKSQTIPVDGEVMVYGFDDTYESHEGVGMDQADKRYRFTPEQFTTHFSEGDLGASYSIWVPWDAAPGAKKKVMLIPTFKSKDGKVIRGNAATLLLPGWTEEEAAGKVIQAGATQANKNQQGVQLASATGVPMHGGSDMMGQANAMGSDGIVQERPRTTTIQMPARAAARVQPLLTPEQATQLLEQARSANFDPATLQQLGVQAPSGAGGASTGAAPALGNDSGVPGTQGMPVGFGNQDMSMQRAMNSGSTPLFHVPSAGMSPSLLPGMPNQLSVMPNATMQHSAGGSGASFGQQGQIQAGIGMQPQPVHSGLNQHPAQVSSNAPSASYPLR